MRDNHTGEELSAGGFVVELTENVIDQTRHIREQAPVMAEERPECFGHGEYELAMGQKKKVLVRQMLGEKVSWFSTTGWARTWSSKHCSWR